MKFWRFKVESKALQDQPVWIYKETQQSVGKIWRIPKKISNKRGYWCKASRSEQDSAAWSYHKDSSEEIDVPIRLESTSW